jgi:asparagine synthase (glutamine-hydrolysing)
MSMAHSVEVRPPFLDHRIVEFAASIPTGLKIRGDRQKYVLKELMRPILPAQIVNRSKVGFDIPTHEWFRGPLRGMLTETFESAEAEHSELFRFDTIRALTAAHMNHSTSIGYHLWGLMILFQWMKRWNVTSAPAPQASREALAIGL